jgi:hypothetical protein
MVELWELCISHSYFDWSELSFRMYDIGAFPGLMRRMEWQEG